MLTLSESLDAREVDRIATVVSVRSEKLTELLCDCPADAVYGHPLRDGIRFQIDELFDGEILKTRQGISQ